MIYPWQAPLWNQLLAWRASLPHALLLHGPRGIGKVQLATAFATSLLCEGTRGPDESACGQCPSCRWIGQGTNPDLRIVGLSSDDEGEEGSARSAAKAPPTQIRITQIRSLQDWIALGSHRNGWRIALIHPAEAMNPASANALLKTLEEPPPNALLLLVAHQIDRLLPTILSRCQKLACPYPEQAVAERWLAAQQVKSPRETLALVGRAPLIAADAGAHREIATSIAADLGRLPIEPLALADRYQSVPVDQVIGLLQKWAVDLANLGNGLPVRYYLEHTRPMGELARQVSTLSMLDWLRELNQARALASHPLNPRLVLEKLFFAYARALAQRA